MRRKLTLLLLTLVLVITLMPTRAFQQGRSGFQAPQTRKQTSGKIVDSYQRGQSGAQPAWVDNAVGRSLAHLRGQSAKHGLADADAELSLLSALRDDLGQTHVRLKQVHKGVPVFGGQLITHLDRDDPDEQYRNFANGRIFKDVRGVSTQPSITSGSALKTAKHLMGREDGFERESVELVVLPEAVRLGNDAFGATLTYKVELLVNNGEEAARHYYFIDARNGSLIWNYDNLQTGLGRGLYAGEVGIGTVFQSPMFRMRDPNRSNGVLCGLPGIITSDFPAGGLCTPYSDTDDIWGNFQPFNTQAAAVDGHHFAALTFDYFMGFHGRNSIDGNGRQMCNRMRNNSAGVNNAFWDGQCTNYGQGSSGRHFASADVVGHEYTHGLTEFTANLIYAEQSGGSNESYSDIFGTMVEFFWGSNPDYLLGEDIAPPIRNMANPRSIPPSIDHLSQFFPGMDPHFSSGLQNVVFYLMSESGNHPTTGVFVKKIGRQRAANVFFRALVMYLGPSSTFADVRQGVELATRDLYSTGNPIWNAVRKAWFSAGVGSDVPFNPIDTSSSFVAQHYRDFLLREGDAGGIAWWAGNIDQCGSDAACEDGMRVNVSRAFWDSMDFQARPDVQASGLLTGNPAQPYNHHQFIRYCYLNYLQREPDPGGWAFWEAHLNSHGDYNALIRAFLYSGEYRSRFGPA
jgi:Zn-dependent metalloprotease